MARMPKHILYNADDLARNLTIEFSYNIDGLDTFKARLWIGKQLIKLACYVMGVNCLFVKNENNENAT